MVSIVDDYGERTARSFFSPRREDARRADEGGKERSDERPQRKRRTGRAAKSPHPTLRATYLGRATRLGPSFGPPLGRRGDGASARHSPIQGGGE